jgi:hypothetical protein
VQLQPRHRLDLLDGQHDIIAELIAELAEVKRMGESTAQARRTAAEEFVNDG